MDAERQLQVRTGFFTLAVLFALALIVGSLTREGGLFTPRYTLFADFHNIEGLAVNGPVHLAGRNIGRIRAIRFLPEPASHDLRVEMDLDQGVAHRIRSDSVASIRTIGLLGDKYIELTIGSAQAREIVDQGIVDTIEPMNYDVLAVKGGELLDNLVALSASADRIVGTFEEAMGTESIASTLGSLQSVVHEIEKGDGLAHALIYDAKGAATVTELAASMGELRGALKRVNQLLKPDDGPGLTAVADSAERLSNILRKIDEGEGTLGGLLNDPSLYQDLKLLVGGAKDSALLRTLIDFVKEDEPNGH